ncbi:Ras GTPase activating protein IRA2 KNAG_0K00890 [Huiozyma naganishii CBS 8797]|uniref:Ras-GAP domain-containing protein n=1 Tax=Huiozyma naganishii (strain ATCC MYA-139 / BCRC 22969 / CBS 8797 / KCTC 17520 / NBRC 10181 / NCYC 3082 / Yp74L-3) TaxID=1071383 RepID=J7SA39_HUIN7|nr:hypothetical protein KNAG_0K00890 [Kazachstania naganishii CBS 8797]CCK72454.1 hypothetical protein KNAG_0K00890 [Kazachstania naganishii CBS 8797]
MTDALLKYIYVDRLYQLLPVESVFKTYDQVEADSYFISCRSIILNVAVSRDLNVVAKHTLDLTDSILEGNDIISPEVTVDAIQSVLVLVRLLNNSMQYYWEYIENFVDEEEDSAGYEIYTDSQIGIPRPVRKIVVGKCPQVLESSVATRLIETCFSLTFHTRTLQIVANLCNHLHNLGNSGYVNYFSILPKYQHYLKENNNPFYTKLMDSTVNNLLRFIAASNPNEYFNFIRNKIQIPLVQQTDDMQVMGYLMLFSNLYMKKSIVLKTLELIKLVLHSLKKQAFQHLLLFFSSKSYIFWIMSRPENYAAFYESLKDFNSKNGKRNYPISSFISGFFDDIYSHYNISGILSSNQNSTSSSNAKTDSMSIESMPVGSSSPFPAQNFQSTKNPSSTTLSNLETRRPIYRANSGTSSSRLYDLLHSSPVSAGSMQQGHISAGNSSSNLSSMTLSSSSISTSQTNFAFDGRSSSMSKDESRASSSDFENLSARSPVQNANDMLKHANESAEPGILQIRMDSSSSQNNAIPVDATKAQGLFIKTKGLDNARLRRKRSSGTSHLEGILSLFSQFNDAETLTHTAPLRFLIILMMFDTELFSVLIPHHFKNLISAERATDQDHNISTERKSSGSTETLSSHPSPVSPNTAEKDKDKGIQLRHFTQGFKKLSLLQPSKKKSVKVISLIIKNLNGSLATCETALLDSMRSCIMLLSLAAPVCLVNNSAPSVIFSKRLIPLLGVNLDIGEKWDSSISCNAALRACLTKHKDHYSQFRIEYFTAALQFELVGFISKLNLQKLNPKTDLENLKLYTESLRIFFYLPGSERMREQIATETSVFLKNILSSVSDIVLEEFPNIGEKISDIVDAIMNGSIVDQFGSRKTFNSGTPSVSSSLRSESPFDDLVSTSSSLKRGYSTDEAVSDWSPQTGFQPTSPIDSPLPYVPSPMSRSRSSDTSNKGPLESSHLATPRASSSTGRNKLFVLNPTDGDENVSSSVSSQRMTVTTSTPSRNIKSFARTPIRANRDSDDNTQKNLKVKLASNLENKLSLVTAEDVQNAKIIMISIFNIFENLLNLFFLPHESNSDLLWISEEFKNIIKPIFIGIVGSDEEIRNSSQAFMDVLMEYIKEFSMDTSAITVNGYILICSYTVCLFSVGLFNLDIDNAKRLTLMNIVDNYLQLRSYLIMVSTDTENAAAVAEADKSTFGPLIVTIGRAAVISLCCTDSKIQNVLKNIYRHAMTIINFYLEHVTEVDIRWMVNIKFIEAMGEDANLRDTSGSLAFQRRVRRLLLKNIKGCDSVVLDCTCEMFKKWKYYDKMDLKLSQEEWTDFRSIAGILAPISGVMLFGYGANEEFENATYKEYLWQLRRDIDYFIYKQCQWLNNSDLIVRENARDLLSVELHPLSFKVLFEHLRSRIDELSSFDLSLPKNDLTYILLEQIIITLRTILRRDDDTSAMVLFSVDIIEIIEQLVILVEDLPHDIPKYFKAVIQMSKMFRALEHSEMNLALKNHFTLKNNWLRVVIRWFKLAITKEYDLENIAKPHREMNLLRRDLDFLYSDTAIESSKALAYLTVDLPLEIVAASSEEEAKRSKYVEFGHDFNILLKGLEKSMKYDTYPVSLRHKMSILNENIILSLTNLSNANIDASLQFIVPMGYSDNTNIRIAFLKVFTNILSSFQVRKDKIESEKLKAMDDLLQFGIRNPQLTYVIASICPANDLDAYATVLVNGLETRNAAHIIVAQLVVDEIRNVSRPTDILRRNSCATRALSMLSKYKGAEYLINTLRPVLQELLNNHDFFEIEKVTPSDPNCKTQVELFKKYMRKLIDAICSSISYFPPEFFYICQQIYTEVKKKFPNYTYIAAGSFVFLRFICPALVNPESENIVEIKSAGENRPFLTLAKIIQQIANGSDNLIKWPSLVSEEQFLTECSCKIFDFLKEVCRPDRNPAIVVRTDGPSKPFEFNFLHQFLVTQEIKIRKRLLSMVKSSDDFIFFKKTFLLLDDVFGRLGEPKMENTQGIPDFVRIHKDKYPRLFEYMNRLAFKMHQDVKNGNRIVAESLTTDNIPVIIFVIGKNATEELDFDTVIYRLLQVYVRIWTSKHYFVLDSTGFDGKVFDIKRVITVLNVVLPDIAISNCKGYYLLNTNQNMMQYWNSFFEHENVYVEAKTPIHFINTNSDYEMIEKLKLGGEGVSVLDDVRVSLNDLTMYDENKKRLTPVSLKLGNKYFQVLDETGKQMKINQLNKLVTVKINEVHEIYEVVSAEVSHYSGVHGEFTVTLNDGTRMIFCNPKYLEIVKMFHYAKAREETGFNDDETQPTMNTSTIAWDIPDSREQRELTTHLLLVMMVGMFHKEDTVKNLSYNLVAEAEKAFHLNFGTRFHTTPEVYVPTDITSFLFLIAQSLAAEHPLLTFSMWKHILNALVVGVVPRDYVPQTLYALSAWVPNLFEYVYLDDEEEGAENISNLFRILIKLTVSDPAFTSIYLREVWFPIGSDGRLTNFLVTEVINHALERDSENREWEKIVTLLSSFPTVEIASILVKRLKGVIESFLPSLQQEALTQSWAELKILVRVSIYVFFESPFITNMFLPELLYVISLLIDVGPTELRVSLHELLMNICSSLTIDDSLPLYKKERIDAITVLFSKQKMKYISGFSQHKGRLLQTFNASSFVSKFNTLEHLVTNMVALMDCATLNDSAQWKTKYRKLLTDVVFTKDSFLSSRATMILGILGKTFTSEHLCRNLLSETMKIAAAPKITEEVLFSVVAQCFTYSAIAEGLDPSSVLLKQLFWLSFTLIDTYHPAIYEGALLMLSKSLKKICEHNLEVNEGHKKVVTILLEARKFGLGLFEQLDEVHKIKWSEENFPSIMLSVVSSGFAVPSIRTVAIDCLKTALSYSYKEHTKFSIPTQYENYMFIMYVVSNAEEFDEILKEIEYDGEVVQISKYYRIPGKLLDWLSSDCESSNIALYQGSIIFTSSSSDEPSKLRYALVMRYLLFSNRICLFRFFARLEADIRRVLIKENIFEYIPILFDITGEIIKYDEYNHIDEYLEYTLQMMRDKGLQIVSELPASEMFATSGNVIGVSDPRQVYKRKRLVVLLLSRIIYL